MNLFIIAMLTLLGCSFVLTFFAIRLDRDYQRDVKRLTKYGREYVESQRQQSRQQKDQ